MRPTAVNNSGPTSSFNSSDIFGKYFSLESSSATGSIFSIALIARYLWQVCAERPIVEIPDSDAIFHTVYDLDARYQIPGEAHLGLGYKNDGKGAHWKGIYDDKGHIMVAASFNSDIGDSWEWADSPHYPEKFSDLGIRIGVNYVVY